jgi:peptidoglycan hydrolase-like protein with peptidoglycan-binding domain
MNQDTSEPRNPKSGVDFVALPAGQAIGRYTIVSVIGHGGFGITYRALDTQLGREVAIKEFLPIALAVRQDGTTVLPRSAQEAADFGLARTRFVEEGRTLASLHDAPAIVRVFDFLEANGTAYLVMQLLSGETLEHRLKRTGPLGPADLDAILWPLLEGLEHVHGAGFLHRDIKPANILLNAAGKPTLIDFGASRAAMAGRTTAMTAIFTPGYAASEQMTSARQGPWTDIYGLSATLYHAIAGKAPSNVFDRMMEDDGYEPLGRLQPPGFAHGLLVGLDAGLAVKASDRPQSIAGWRPILGQTIADGRAVTSPMPRSTAGPAAAAPPVATKQRKSLWIGLAAAVLVVAAGGSYLGLTPSAPPAVDEAAVKRPAAEEEARRVAQDALAAQQRADAEAARLKAAATEEAQRKADAEAADKKRLDDEARLKAEADAAEKKRTEDAARQKAEADALRRTEGDERKAAEATEAALRLGQPERQKIQVALTSLGFDTRGADGTLGARTREMIASWQRSRGHPPTGYLTAAQQRALLSEAAPAISKFDEDEKRKVEEARRKAEEETKARATPPPAPVVPTAPSAAAAGFDGLYAGSLSSSTPSGGQSALRPLGMELRVAGGQVTGEMVNFECGAVPISLAVAPSGAISGTLRMYEGNCSPISASASGRVSGNTLVLEIRGMIRSARGSLTRRDE